LKLRDLEAKLRAAGFVESRRKGKGSHRKWFHSAVGRPLILSGKPGDEAKPYQVKQVDNAVAIVEGDKS
jgi:predicted RNA binding protein YcfA (HicA-like mRNA interferase family)